MRRFLSVIAIAASACTLVPAFAADHRDSPIATNDPGADINDVYTFVNPRNPAELIVAVTVVPFANPLSRFSDAVDYRIHIDNGGGTEQVITCRFPGSVRVECGGITGLSAAGTVGKTINGSGGLRVFTGLRDDPFFFDLDAFNATRNALAPRFVNPGRNFFAGANTLTIALGLPNAAINSGGTRSTVKVYSSTRRTGGAGISSGISGTWFDARNPGQGILLEVIRGMDGREQLSMAWFTFDQGGRQLFLFGTGPINGGSAVIPTNYSLGGGFLPDGRPNDVQIRPYGNVTFNFSNCNSGNVTYQTNVLNLPASGTFNLTRLTSISDQSCSFLSTGQIDRMGRPGINTALINLVPSTGTAIKDAYNRAEGLANWAQFTSEIQANLAALDTLDGRANAVLPASALAGVLVDDRLIVNTSVPACDEYLAVELGVAGKCGGRTLSRDVIDDTFGAVVGPGVSDFVANDSVFLTDFPFLNEPN
jgi:Domain of unknown function (DUF4331)